MANKETYNYTSEILDKAHEYIRGSQVSYNSNKTNAGIISPINGALNPEDDNYYQAHQMLEAVYQAKLVYAERTKKMELDRLEVEYINIIDDYLSNPSIELKNNIKKYYNYILSKDQSRERQYYLNLALNYILKCYKKQFNEEFNNIETELCDRYYALSEKLLVEKGK